jgi:hypothetical protein
MKLFVRDIVNFLNKVMRRGKKLNVSFVTCLTSCLTFCLTFCLASCLTSCHEWPSEESSEKKIEYTDVEYSEDGKEIKLYLDGASVPKTPAQAQVQRALAQGAAQRAMTRDLATMAYDYVEVIFQSVTPAARIVRTAWELGQPANINDVLRGVNYNQIYGAATGGNACIFVGRKEGKVLLGVGRLSNASALVTDSTTSVTFELTAIQTGLKIGTYVPTDLADSFTYGGGTRTNSFTSPALSGVSYPVYRIADGTSITSVTGTYTFYFVNNNGATNATGTYTPAIRHTSPLNIVIQKRTPRYPSGAGYKEPRNSIDTSTEIALNAYSGVANGAFVNAIPLIFSSIPAKNVLFAFNIQIPVYMVTQNPPINSGGTAAETWFIRTGIGTEFYSLDDGKEARGGCVLVSIGVTASSWNNIEWTWFKE